jgi:hypothetical protein
MKENKMLSQRVKALQEVFAAKPDLKSKNSLSDFLSDYLLCEALANKLILYLETDDPPKPINPKKNICSSCGAENESVVKNKKPSAHFKTLDVRKIKKALIHFSIVFSDDETDAIFKSGDGKVGNRTARQLRNEYAHSLSVSACKEMCERAPYFLELMNRFQILVKSSL